MQPAEAFRVLLFVGVVATVYVLAAGTLVGLVLQRLGRRPAAATRRAIWTRRAVLGVAAAGLLCTAYGYFVEPYWLSVTRVRLTSAKLSSGAPPLRIVQLSDLHCDAQPRLEERLPDAVAAERPDLIVFTGDAVNSPAGLPVFKRCLARLAALAPTFVVKGNWDAWFWRALDLYDGTGARELAGEAVKVAVGGQDVWIVGVPVDGETRMESALAAVPAGAYTVFLYHYPDLIEEVARRNVDLYCAGHTHGGQVALPFYGALVTLSRFGKRYEAGLYRVEGTWHCGTWLYVNRGIGMEGGPVPRVRFCARPEVTVIEVGPE